MGRLHVGLAAGHDGGTPKAQASVRARMHAGARPHRATPSAACAELPAQCRPEPCAPHPCVRQRAQGRASHGDSAIQARVTRVVGAPMSVAAAGVATLTIADGWATARVVVATTVVVGGGAKTAAASASYAVARTHHHHLQQRRHHQRQCVQTALACVWSTTRSWLCTRVVR